MPPFIVHDYCGDAISKIVDTLKSTFADYDLSEVTADNVQVVNVIDSHPIAIIGGQFVSSGAITAKLPMVGVVMMNDTSSQQFLGSGTTVNTLSKDHFTNAYKNVPIKERWRNGLIVSDSHVGELDAYFETPNDSLQYEVSKEMRGLAVKISIWSHHPHLNRILSYISRSVIMQFRKELKGFKLLKYEGVGNLYNYDFGQTLHGFDWNISLENLAQNNVFDINITTIKEIETAVATEDDALDDDTANPQFKALGRDDKYKPDE